MNREDPVVYGIWVKRAKGWLETSDGLLIHSVSRNAMLAYMNRSSRYDQADRSICMIGPDGLPEDEQPST